MCFKCFVVSKLRGLVIGVSVYSVSMPKFQKSTLKCKGYISAKCQNSRMLELRLALGQMSEFLNA